MTFRERFGYGKAWTDKTESERWETFNEVAQESIAPGGAAVDSYMLQWAAQRIAELEQRAHA